MKINSQELLICRGELIKSLQIKKGMKDARRLCYNYHNETSMSYNRCSVVFLSLFHPCLACALFISWFLSINNLQGNFVIANFYGFFELQTKRSTDQKIDY